MTERKQGITDIWRKLVLSCGRTVGTKEGGKPKYCCGRMLPELTSRGVEYVCNHCGQRYSYFEAEKMLNVLAEMIINEAKEGNEINLTNYRFKKVYSKKGIIYEYLVLKHDSNILKVSINDNKTKD